MKPRGAIFDLDGTLVDSIGDIADSMNHALGSLGLPAHPETAYLRFVGEGVRRLAEKVLGPVHLDRQEALLAAYQARYAEHLLDRSRPYPGIADGLAQLTARKVPLAVLSNKPEPATKRMIAALFPDTPWRAVAGDVSAAVRKPDPRRALWIAQALDLPAEQIAFVGDTRVDVETARAAGMISVGVTWGFRDRAELVGAGATVVVDDAAALFTLF